MSCVALLALGACGSSGGGNGGFVIDDVTTPIFAGNTGRLDIASGGGVTFANRIVQGSDGGNIFEANIRTGATVGTAPTAGTATMTGPFALRQATGVTRVGGVNQGTLTNHSGMLSVTADFGAGTLTGSGDGLAIDGTLAGGDVSGSASFGGVTGELAGFVGSQNAIGIFKGVNGTSSIAGGFIVAK